MCTFLKSSKKTRIYFNRLLNDSARDQATLKFSTNPELVDEVVFVSTVEMTNAIESV